MNKVVLASGSPRRIEILSQYNLSIKVVKSNIEEKVNIDECPIQVAMSLALQKALDVSERMKNDEIVIAADTLVYNNQILGKPSNKEDALEMLMNLNGKIHSVYTGIALLQPSRNLKIIDYVETKVKFRDLSKEKLENYININEYSDKAGAYAIQGVGTILVDYIIGSYTNVVGLPISKLDKLLEKYFNISLM